jgi:hypothetical protein
MERRGFGPLTLIVGLSRAGGRCECGGCSCCGYASRCWTSVGNGFEADHAVRRDDNSLENLRILCKGCHRAKTDSAGSLARALFGAQTAHTNALANALMQPPPAPPAPDRLAACLLPPPPPPWLSAFLPAPPPPDPQIAALVRAIAPPPPAPLEQPNGFGIFARLGAPPPNHY